MMGHNHIICTSSMLVAFTSIHIACDKIHSGLINDFLGIDAQKLSVVCDIDYKIWSTFGLNSVNLISPSFVLFVLFVIFGTLCTDCDSKNSIMGRIIHIPVEHRTWLHAIWIPLLCYFAGYYSHQAMWFAFGWFLHEFMDSFSACGNSYLYPIVGYRKYGKAKVKKGIHNFKLYHAGEKSETIFVIFVVAICIFISFIALKNSYI